MLRYLLMAIYLLGSISSQAEQSQAGSRLPLTLKTLESPPETPNFSLPDVQGKKHQLSDYAGTPLLLHFWASWCSACRVEVPLLQALQTRFSETELKIVLIAADNYQAAQTLSQSVPDIIVLFDQYGSALRAFRLKGLPASYLIDAHSQLCATAIGANDWNALESQTIIEQCRIK